MQVYDIQISSATDVERINAQGDYIYYSSGSAGGSSPCVEVRGINTGFRVKLLPGQGMRLPMGKVERDWLIKPDASIAGGLIGAVVIGEGEIFDNRVTGTVQAIDGELERSKAGVAFSAYAAVTGVAGNYAYQELWNPANSGRRIVVSDVTYSSQIGTGFVISRIGAAIGGSFEAFNKSSGGGVSVAKIGRGVLSSIGGISMEVAYISEGTPYMKSFKQPYVAEPGSGIVVSTMTPGGSQFSTMQFIEESL